MSLSSFFSSFLPVVHADAPEEKEVKEEAAPQEEEETQEEPQEEEEEAEEPEDVRRLLILVGCIVRGVLTCGCGI